jgi:hypothetical protein
VVHWGTFLDEQRLLLVANTPGGPPTYGWQTTTDPAFHPLRASRSVSLNAAVSPDHTAFASPGEGGDLLITDIGTGSTRQLPGVMGSTYNPWNVVRWSPDGKSIVVGRRTGPESGTGEGRLVDVASGRSTPFVQCQAAPAHVGLHPDGLARVEHDDLVGQLHAHGAAHHDGQLAKLGRLRRLAPPGRRDHVRQREAVGAGVDAAKQLFDELAARHGDGRGLLDQLPAAHGVNALVKAPAEPNDLTNRYGVTVGSKPGDAVALTYA